MRARLVLVGVALALLVPASASSGRQKAYVLTALANIGTVYWRYDCVHYRAPEWSLGVRWSAEASTLVTYRAGRLLRGTLRARVTVDWRGGGHCEAYLPPRLTVQMYPRG